MFTTVYQAVACYTRVDTIYTRSSHPNFPHTPTFAMASRKRKRVLDIDDLQLAEVVWETTRFQTDPTTDGSEHEYTAYEPAPPKDRGIRFATYAPTDIPEGTTPVEFHNPHAEHEDDIQDLVVSKTKVIRRVASGAGTETNALEPKRLSGGIHQIRRRGDERFNGS